MSKLSSTKTRHKLALLGLGKKYIAASGYIVPLMRFKKMVDLKRNSFRGYSNVITDLPEADIPFEGIKAWILQGEIHQLAFMQMEAKASIPEHGHDYAEWGMVIEGEMKLTIEGKTRNCKKGDEFLIPIRAKHELISLAKSRVIFLFSERTRYRTKPVTL